MKKILISIIIFSFLLCGCQKTTPLSHKEFCLDTIVQITLYDSSSKNILNNCFNLCKKYELVFSANNKESELYKINHAHHKLDEQPLSKELFKVIKEGLYYSQLSQGAFDITIGSVSSLWNFKENKLPDDQQIKTHLNDISYQNIILDNQKIRFLNEQTMIDLGAIAKGYIADQIKSYLLKNKVNSALINLGGNILCVGQKNNNPFSIGITDPQNTNHSILSLNINNLSIVTSGTYQRYIEINSKKYHHILNSSTGYCYDNGLSSVTIISKSSLQGDALSTVCFALGKEKGLALLNSIKNVSGCFIDDHNQISYSKNFKKYLSN